VKNFSFFISVKMCSVSPVDELHALGQTQMKINMFIKKKKRKKKKPRNKAKHA
jgi:hypothetical protein